MADHSANSYSSLQTGRCDSRADPAATDLSDGSLVRRFRRGDSDAATALYLRYVHRLNALANANVAGELRARFDSEDVVQSVFRTFFRRVSTGNYDVPDGDELWGLLLVVTLNKSRKLAVRHRAAKRNIRRTVDAGESQPLDGFGCDRASMAELQFAIDEFTEALNEQDRRIVEMRVDGCEVAEIAKNLGKSKRTVERILQRIRNDLRERLDE